MNSHFYVFIWLSFFAQHNLNVRTNLLDDNKHFINKILNKSTSSWNTSSIQMALILIKMNVNLQA